MGTKDSSARAGVDRTSEEGPGEGHVMNIGYLTNFPVI